MRIKSQCRKIPVELIQDNLFVLAEIGGEMKQCQILKVYPDKREVQLKEDRPQYNAYLYYISFDELYFIW